MLLIFYIFLQSIFGLIGHCLYIRFGRVGLFLSIYLKLPVVYLAIFKFTNNHFYYVEGMSTAIILLNRLTALLWPLKYEKIWGRLWYWAIILAYLLPLILSWHILISEIVIRVHDNETFSLYTQIKPDEPKDTLTTSWFSVLFTIICLLINIACIYVYRKTKIASSQQTQSKQKTETLLTFYSLLTFFGQLLFTFYTIILYISSSQLQKFINPDLAELIFLSIYNQYAWVNDISTIAIPAFLLLWASEMMRSRIYSLIQIICFLPKNTNNNAVMVIPKQNFTNYIRQKQTK
uniref:Serpentine receptor class gamma n=1 Tax=Meloidogyne incognita TaxID=6306 RepID=A0A914NMP0_MELIC